MPYEQRDMSGSMFKNDDKFDPGTNIVKQGANPDWPDRKGQAMIGGVMYWVSGWLKTSKGGQPWLSLSFTAQGARGNPQVVGQRHEPGPSDAEAQSGDLPTGEDEIPF